MSGAPVLRVDRLTKRYGETRALQGVTFEVTCGTIFSLLGRNGSGKTTTVRILTGLTAPSSGRAEVLGHDVTVDPASVRARIGVTLQEAALDEVLTGREFLTLVASIVGLSRTRARARAEELLALFGLTSGADRPIGTYSGGMQRRVDLAASLVRRPEILFLDEPTTGLDPQNRRALWEQINRLREEGTTIFLTTQYLEEAETLADEIAILNDGRLVDASTPDALRTRHGRTWLRLQVADHLRAPVRDALPIRTDARDNGGSIVVPVDDAADALRILTSLEKQRIVVDDFEIRRDSLEEVFLHITGTDTASATAPTGAVT